MIRLKNSHLLLLLVAALGVFVVWQVSTVHQPHAGLGWHSIAWFALVLGVLWTVKRMLENRPQQTPTARGRALRILAGAFMLAGIGFMILVAAVLVSAGAEGVARVFQSIGPLLAVLTLIAIPLAFRMVKK